MAKKQINIRADDRLIEKLNEMSVKTGKSKTDIILQAIDRLNTNSKKTHQQIELLNKQNEQLQTILSATKAVLAEKDNVIRGKDDLIKSKDDLIAVLKRKHKGLFARLGSWFRGYEG